MKPLEEQLEEIKELSDRIYDLRTELNLLDAEFIRRLQNFILGGGVLPIIED
jgi:hypothetical protein